MVSSELNKFSKNDNRCIMSSKKPDRNKEALQIYARVRGLMPWEEKKVSLKVVSNTVQNKAGKVINCYDFRKVFKPESTNEQCFHIIAMPMISNVIKGFNAILIAYGQTGSGKTFSMLGKPKLGIVGILPRMLEYMCNQKTVSRVELSAVEAFGHHVAKIFLFDLFNETNQVTDWSLKKGVTTMEMCNATAIDITDSMHAHDQIVYAHAASHFAPTGKNPESSRGHVSFIAKIHQELGGHQVQISYFIMVDCAGSEGETAFTPAFRASVSAQVLLCRRLEAGTINTGLSQLQVIFNELRLRGKLSKTLGNGLRRVLHPYINTKTFLSVLFTLSPSINNCKATESTLKFAVTAGMVKVKPIQTEGTVNLKSLVKELKAHIEQQEKQIDLNNGKIEALRRQQNQTTLAIESAQNPSKFRDELQGQDKVEKTRMVKVQREVIDENGEVVIKEEWEEETYYEAVPKTELTLKEIVREAVGADVGVDGEYTGASEDVLQALEDAAKELLAELSDEMRASVTSRRWNEEKDGEDDGGLMAPWQKEMFVKQKKREIERKKKEEEEEKEAAASGLLLINEQIEKSQNDYKRLQETQKELMKTMIDKEHEPAQRQELTDHGMELQIMLANQESVTQGLRQSKQIIMDYLKEDGREALIQFFKMRKLV
eukprot:630519_1